MSTVRTSTGDSPNKYMKGYAFWSKNTFWRTDKTLTQSGKDYYENWLKDLKKNDKRLAASNDIR